MHRHSSIAQLVEHGAVNSVVPGSSPGGGVRAIGAAVAQLLYTQLVTGSNPVSPIINNLLLRIQIGTVQC